MIRAQSRADRLEFEVASLKPSRDEGGGSLLRTPGGLNATNSEFTVLLEMAFQTRQIDLSRVPPSLRSERFDIVARSAGRITGDQYWKMLQSLLEDRFRLAYHIESRNVPVYTLNFANKSAKLGPRISNSAEADCPQNPTPANFCGVNTGLGALIGQRVPMPRIARELSAFAGRPVLDHTGLTGAFDFQLIWTPDQGGPTAADKLKAAGNSLDSSGASFFPAVEEQLGLKLEPSHGQIEILVIDRAEQPSEN